MLAAVLLCLAAPVPPARPFAAGGYAVHCYGDPGTAAFSADGTYAVRIPARASWGGEFSAGRWSAAGGVLELSERCPDGVCRPSLTFTRDAGGWTTRGGHMHLSRRPKETP